MQSTKHTIEELIDLFVTIKCISRRNRDEIDIVLRAIGEHLRDVIVEDRRALDGQLWRLEALARNQMSAAEDAYKSFGGGAVEDRC